jgi:predicted nucleic acid-binding protein
VKVFVDTSALLAVIDRADEVHASGGIIWRQLIEQDAQLVTTNYVLVETHALIQRRLGMQFVHALEEQVVPLLNVIWIDETLHQAGLTTLRAANRRQLSLVDCVSFALCRQSRIQSVFAFDAHFSEQGFDLLSA